MRSAVRHLPLKRKALSMSCVSALLCGALLASPSCSTPPLTEIIVSVDSTFPSDELDMVRLLIDRNGDSRVVTVDLSEGEGTPFTQGVVHRGGSLDVSISAEGSLDGEVLLVQIVPVQRFVVGETLRVSVVLSPSCVGVMCVDGSTCMDGACAPLLVDAGTPDAGDAGLFDARPLVDAMAGDTSDAGSGMCPTKRANIGGDYICAEDCENCDLKCENAGCRVTCRSGASCDVDGEDYDVTAECEPGSTCSIKTKNNKRGGITARCVRSTCEVNCDGDGPCNVLCDNSACELECHDNEDCTLRGCASEPEDCGDNRFVCGRECR